MAELVDSLLQLLTAQGADTLVIPASRPPWLEKRGERQPLSMPPLGPAMVQELIAELGVTEGDDAEHRTPDGRRFFVSVQQRDDGPQLTLRHANAEVSTTPQPTPTVRPAEPSRAATPATPSSEFPDLLDLGVLRPLLEHAQRTEASDILLSNGIRPRVRVGGEVVESPTPPIGESELLATLGPVLGDRGQAELAERGSTDLALQATIDGAPTRYRAHLFRQHGGLALALRPIRNVAPTVESLHLPVALYQLASLASGLVLVTGTAGSGKSTSLVAMVESINRRSAKHVVTLEDPIEYMYENDRALVHQRQIGVHVNSFGEGLRAALRESPDVILVGEMRDRETMQAALTAAETGHLVLSTLHAADASMAVDRMLDCFAEHQQAQVRLQLASTLRAVVTQRLLPSLHPPLRVPAVEIMRVNTAVATKIREGRGHQLQSEIHTGRADGMISFEATMSGFVRQGLLSAKVALAASRDRDLMQELLNGRG